MVLKILPSTSEAQQEFDALEYYQGVGCVKLLEKDVKQGVLLRDYVYNPSLLSIFPNDDEAATLYTVQVIKKLHSKKLGNTGYFCKVSTWLSDLNSNNVIPKTHISKALDISTELMRSQKGSVLLHGDLHHGNILSDGLGGWVAIDPKGVVGEPMSFG